MGFFNLFRKADMTEQLEACQANPQAILLDVRTPDEYSGGRIPGSVNLPLDRLNREIQQYPEDTPLYIYCRSGARSSIAAEELERMGYRKVVDLGGLNGYRGKLER